VQRGQVVLVDTNIIIESVRTGCWNGLTTYFKVETVEKCCEEARTGEAHRPEYVNVDEPALRTRLTAHKVSGVMLFELGQRYPDADRLDVGERHLWAHALGRNDEWLAACSDRAAVNAAVQLGWGDRLVSLEELVTAAGARSALRSLKGQFSSARLSEWRTAALIARGLK
jgi:hypothetical protein